MSSAVTVETTELAPGYRIPRILKGGWQLAGGHGPVDRERAIADMGAFVEAGITAFDCADIYTGAEEMIGDFLRQFRRDAGAGAASKIKVHTKFVPDLGALPTLDRAYVERIVDRSLMRLGVERLDLVQFHWWDYSVPRYIEAAHFLKELQQAGKIDRLGGTNFDAGHAAEIIDAGVDLVSMQVQYSLLDRRPGHALAGLCAGGGMTLLCYGTLAGGLLSENWLDAPEPAGPLENRSHVKYKLIIDEFGGWALYQRLLRALKLIADRHQTNVAAVATRFVLDRPHVAGAIVDARYADRLPETLAVFDLVLDRSDRDRIDEILRDSTGPSGDVYALERDRTGRHGTIMKYNLNRAAGS